MHYLSTLFCKELYMCFREVYCPSSQVLILYSQQLVFAIPQCVRKVTVHLGCGTVQLKCDGTR